MWITTIVLAIVVILLAANGARCEDADKWDRHSNAGKDAAKSGNLTQAEAYLRNALKMAEEFSPGDTRLPATLRDLADVYAAAGKDEQAIPLLLRALNFYKQFRGPEDPDVAESSNRLAEVYLLEGKYAEAEPLLKKALDIFEKNLGSQDSYIARTCHNLGFDYMKQGKFAEAEPYFLRALTLREKSLGANDPEVGKTMLAYAELLRSTNRAVEADQMEKKAKAILAMP